MLRNFSTDGTQIIDAQIMKTSMTSNTSIGTKLRQGNIQIIGNTLQPPPLGVLSAQDPE